AIQVQSLVYPGAVSFGKWSKQDRRKMKEVTLTVENVGVEPKTYYVTPPINAPDGIQWKTPFSFTLNAGEKKKIKVAMDIFPQILAEGIHHGEIVISSKSEKISVPYLLFIEEPNYPRLMAFSFERGDAPDTF